MPAADLPQPNDDVAAAPARGSALRTILSWALVVVISVLLATAARAAIAQAYVIPSESMAGTLQVDDRVLAQRPLFDFNGINRGDIVVFDHPARLNNGQGNEFVKRVIATGGDSIEARGGAVFVNDVALHEPYVVGSTHDFGPVQVAEGHLFVMGDNRNNSSDSRVFGTIPESTVNGSVFGRVWPLDRIGSVG